MKDIGAIVELPGGKDALVHISELSMEPVESVAAAVKVGDKIDVMIVGQSGNSTRASVAAIERVAKGLPMVEKRTRRSPDGESRGGRGGRGRGRGGRDGGRDGGRGRNGGRARDGDRGGDNRPYNRSSDTASTATSSPARLEVRSI